MKTWNYQPEGFYLIEDCALNCDADGANGQTNGVACYVPNGSGLPSLDALACAGRPGKWWGILTDNGEEWGNPVLQKEGDPVPGAYITTTSWQDRTKDPRDPNRYLDAAAVDFIVVPERFIRGVPGIVLGCKAEVEYNGIVIPAMVGDSGPDFGEFSLHLCKQIDPRTSARNTNIESGVTVRVWPGVPAVLGGRTYELQRFA